ncbi:MAG: hypothetical protein Q4B58_08910 [Bacteroidales bacterium]|nr:hypothetical protein [Bacteroidales bacterium]
MANICNTELKVYGRHEHVQDLWNTLTHMEANSKNVWLSDIAEHYGIDCQTKHISCRGKVYYAELETEEVNGNEVLTICTETAWTRSELFEVINKDVFKDECEVAYREMECGCDIYCVHDPQGLFFPEECCVTAYGEPFEEACEDVYATIEDAIKEWTSKTGIEQEGRTQEQMVEFINEYEYENGESYFYIHPFVFE